MAQKEIILTVRVSPRWWLNPLIQLGVRLSSNGYMPGDRVIAFVVKHSIKAELVKSV